MKLTIKMTRVYETIVDITADSYQEALIKFDKIKYEMELEQMNVTSELVEHSNLIDDTEEQY